MTKCVTVNAKIILEISFVVTRSYVQFCSDSPHVNASNSFKINGNTKFTLNGYIHFYSLVRELLLLLLLFCI